MLVISKNKKQNRNKAKRSVKLKLVVNNDITAIMQHKSKKSLSANSNGGLRLK